MFPFQHSRQRRPNVLIFSIGIFLTTIAVRSASAQTSGQSIVQDVTLGDRGCQIDLFVPPEQRLTKLARREVCQKSLIGKPVTLTYETVAIENPYCVGASQYVQDCQATKNVNLITQVIPVNQPKVGTIQAQRTDKQACYVTVQDAQGNTSNHYALFPLCAKGLLGQRAQLNYLLAEIIDARCLEALPTCNQGPTNKVWYISQAKVMRRPSPNTYYPALGTVVGLTSVIGPSPSTGKSEKVCYVDVVSPFGQRTKQYATPNICQQKLLNQRVEFVYEKADDLPVHQLCGQQAAIPDGACTGNEVLQIVSTQTE